MVQQTHQQQMNIEKSSSLLNVHLRIRILFYNESLIFFTIYSQKKTSSPNEQLNYITS